MSTTAVAELELQPANNRSAFGSQQLGMATTDTLTCSGNYGDFAS